MYCHLYEHVAASFGTMAKLRSADNFAGLRVGDGRCGPHSSSGMQCALLMRFNVPISVPLFDPHEWSVHQRTLDGADRTNNFNETFHRKFKNHFGCTHPTIWRFIDSIRCVQKVIDAEISRCVMREAAPLKKKKYREPTHGFFYSSSVITMSTIILSLKMITIMLMSM
ncbi:hypothetical protein niasHT_020367 [Heterodera trifolii]|uniref:Transposase n=1 Tax=Heterodera trifolii TaxID=157864 RepID=A0ABD2JX71_9BILA